MPLVHINRRGAATQRDGKNFEALFACVFNHRRILSLNASEKSFVAKLLSAKNIDIDLVRSVDVKMVAGDSKNDLLFSVMYYDHHKDDVHFYCQTKGIPSATQFFVNEAFHEACKNGDLELVKIYTNHPQIAPHLDMDKVYNDSFHWACIKHQKHVIDYLILEKNYPQTKFIEDLIKGASNFLNDDKGIALRQYIDKLFNYKQLNDELPEKSVTKNKRKI